MDSPVASDPQRRPLLEDLELVLVQIVQLSPGSTPQDREMIEKTLQQDQVMTRLRTAIPAGRSVVVEDTSMTMKILLTAAAIISSTGFGVSQNPSPVLLSDDSARGVSRTDQPTSMQAAEQSDGRSARPQASLAAARAVGGKGPGGFALQAGA